MARSHKPGFREMLFFLVSGVIVSIPMALFFEESSTPLSSVLPPFEAEVLVIAILAPLIEEFSKAWPLLYRHGESQKSLFTMGLLVGFGFGITEFFEYVLLLGVPFQVRLPGIFFHAALTSIVAYGIASRRSALFYLVAVVFHGLANFMAIAGAPVLPYALWLGTAMAIAFILYTKTSDRVLDY